MLTPIQLLPGYRFNPYDEELVRFYLYPKLTNPCFATSAPVRDCSLYAYQPLQIWNTFHRIHGEDVFFFTDLKKMSPKSNNNISRQIAGGPATWRRDDKDHHIRVQIDKNYSVTALRKGFSYRNTQPHQPGCKWTMYEYSLPSLSEVTVLCQLRRKDNDKTHQSTQKNKKRKRAGAHGVDDAGNTKSQEARVDQHSMVPYRASESVSEDVFNGVSFEDFESLYCENMLDFDCCEMAANPITSSTGHFSPTTVSTLNPAENLKSFEALRIDSDGEAAANKDDDMCQEILERLNSTFFYDEVDVVPAIEAAPVQGDGVQAAQVGSTLIESFTSEAVDHHPESEVSANSSLTSDWIQSFPPAAQQANPTCSLIHENRIQMIPNTFFMDCFY
ncbi:putative proteinC DOMAIN-CONTAINING PROTEIN 82-RELATED [Salix viminalis]|uniref:NAC domain-containing protein n=1 Tax=Salix viminalis TaxID=40686 RepID=A0A9Q0Z7T7_SALVM|nr:putative proteinC DOMAIN-CONTAINING PROTEIN 82-RELATED [Salix viminalis]